jgi:hypothetical protein
MESYFDHEATKLRQVVNAIGFDLSTVDNQRRQQILAMFVPSSDWSERLELRRQRFAKMERTQFDTVYATMLVRFPMANP